MPRCIHCVTHAAAGAAALALLAIFAAEITGESQARSIAFRFSSVITMSGAPVKDGVIVVEGDRIKSVGSGNRAVPAGAEVIDMRPLAAIPGLIDAHTHMTYVWDPASGTRPLSQPPREPAETLRLQEANARKTLETGVTTVRDLGAGRGADYAMRDAINAGRMTGPRMFVAGSGISGGRTGGPGAAAMAALVDTRIKAGSDWIKVYASRGSYQSVDTTQTLTYEELKAIVDAAHAQAKPVAVHSYGASGVRDAVRAGADSVEHGIEIDDETFGAMKKQGTVWVPTVDHNRYYVDAKDEYGFAPETIPPLQEYIQKNFESTRRAMKAGVKLAMGSDAVYSMFGQNTRELGWFVKAGMTPLQALQTATTIPAAMLKMEGKIGVLAPGAYADIVAVEGDPLKDIQAVIAGVKTVIKGGAVVKK